MTVVLKTVRGLRAVVRPSGLVVLLAVLLFAAVGCGRGDRSAEGEQPPSTEAAASGTAAGASDKPAASTTSESVTRSTERNEGGPVVGSEDRALPRLVDLGADKCVPCKMMAPILEELRETCAGQLQVDFIDVWKDPAPAKQYGIRVIPTQIFFDENGTELFRHQGFMSGEDILAKWAELGYEFEA